MQCCRGTMSMMVRSVTRGLCSWAHVGSLAAVRQASSRALSLRSQPRHGVSVAHELGTRSLPRSGCQQHPQLRSSHTFVQASLPGEWVRDLNRRPPEKVLLGIAPTPIQDFALPGVDHSTYRISIKWVFCTWECTPCETIPRLHGEGMCKPCETITPPHTHRH